MNISKNTLNWKKMTLLVYIGLALQLILMFIIPVSDSYISLVVISIFSIITLISLYYLFMYYYLLPDFKQNILVYLTRLLVAFHGIQIIYNLPIEIVLNCFKKQLILHFKDYLEFIILSLLSLSFTNLEEWLSFLRLKNYHIDNYF